MDVSSRGGMHHALNIFHSYSPATKAFVSTFDINQRKACLMERYYVKYSVAPALVKRIKQLRSLFPDIKGYGRSLGRYPWVEIVVLNTDRLEDIESHFYQDIVTGYLRLYLCTSSSKCSGDWLLASSPASSTEGTVGAILGIDEKFFALTCAHCIVSFDNTGDEYVVLARFIAASNANYMYDTCDLVLGNGGQWQCVELTKDNCFICRDSKFDAAMVEVQFPPDCHYQELKLVDEDFTDFTSTDSSFSLRENQVVCKIGHITSLTLLYPWDGNNTVNCSDNAYDYC